MFLTGNAEDTSTTEDRPVTTSRQPRAARSARGRVLTGFLEEEKHMSQTTRPTDDDRYADLTTVANPKRVRLASPVLTDTSERD